MHNANPNKIHFLVWTFSSILLIISSLSIASTNQTQPTVIRIASHNLPPYHWLNDEGKFVGPAATAIECIFTKLNQDYEISIYPWPRTQELVRIKTYDAFFIGSRSSKRDQYATFSTPFHIDRWYFYYNPNSVFDLYNDQIKRRYLGVLLGSNMEQWLTKQGYSNLLSGRDYSHLFKLLNLGRLDIVMATEGIYKTQMELGNWASDMFVGEKIRDLEMGIYFGHHFLDVYPSYLRQFNKIAQNCESQ